MRIVGVEHRGPGARHRLDDHALDVRELADRVDPAQAQVVAGDVRDDRHVVAVVAQALAQDAAPGDLEHRRVHGRVLEHHLGRLRAAHVALLDQPPVDDDAVRRGHPDPPAHELEDVGDHPDRRRLAVRAGHREDRDPGGRAGREERVHDRPSDVLWLALGRVGVHPEPGRGVDLDDRAAGLADGRLDVRADEVDAGDVEPHDARCRLGDLDVVGVRLERPVDRRPAGRHVAGQRELDPDPGRGHAVELQALGLDERLGRLVELDPGEDLLVADAPPWIRIGRVHELADRVLAVARRPKPGPAPRPPPGGRRSRGRGSRCRGRTSRRRHRRPGSRAARPGTPRERPPRTAGRGGRPGRGCRRAA